MSSWPEPVIAWSRGGLPEVSWVSLLQPAGHRHENPSLLIKGGAETLGKRSALRGGTDSHLVQALGSASTEATTAPFSTLLTWTSLRVVRDEDLSNSQ